MQDRKLHGFAFRDLTYPLLFTMWEAVVLEAVCQVLCKTRVSRLSGLC